MSMVSWGLEIKSKLIGTFLILLPALLLILIVNSLLQSFSLLVALVFVLLLAGSLLSFSIGFKLILYTSIRPISLNEVKKRVLKSQKTDKTKYPAVIALCGVDGSGKTTQINLIKNNLGIANRKFNLRWAAFISYPFLAVMRVLGYSRWEPNIHGVLCINHYFYKNVAIAKVWAWFFTIDLFLRSILTLKLSLARGFIVLCDRSPIDALIDLMAETGDHTLMHKPVGKLLLSIINPNSIVVLLDMHENGAFARKRDVLSLEYLQTRRQLYLSLARELCFPIVDATNKSETDLHLELQKFFSHKPFWFLKD